MADQDQKRFDRPVVIAFRTTGLVKRALERLAKRKKQTVSVYLDREVVGPHVRRIDNGDAL